MRREYTLKSGKVIHCWYNRFAGVICIQDDNGNEIEAIKVNTEDENATFEYEGEVIHVDDYNYMTVRELLTKCRERAIADGKDPSDMNYLRENELLCTILKDTEHFGIVSDVECYNTIIPGLGIAFKGSGSTHLKVLTIPFERRYKKDDWHYKVELKPANDDIAQLTGSECYYFSDLVGSIRCGHMKLVDIEDFKEEAKKLDEVALQSKAKLAVL